MKDVDICNAGERFKRKRKKNFPDDCVLKLKDGNIANECGIFAQ